MPVGHNVHEVAICYPRDLGSRPQVVRNDVQAGGERGLVYEGQEVRPGTGEEYLLLLVAGGLRRQLGA